MLSVLPAGRLLRPTQYQAAGDGKEGAGLAPLPVLAWVCNMGHVWSRTSIWERSHLGEMGAEFNSPFTLGRKKVLFKAGVDTRGKALCRSPASNCGGGRVEAVGESCHLLRGEGGVRAATY